MKINIEYYDIKLEAEIPDESTYTELMLLLEGLTITMGYPVNTLIDYKEGII